MKFIHLFTGIFLIFSITASAQHRITPEDEARAKELVSRMTIEEKIDYIGGLKSFYIRAIPRLGIPQIRMADGPCGVRNNTKSTLYPCGICSAASWNRDAVEALGHGLGADAKARGVDIMLGPGVNIYRSPLCGRNYEYFGEDPYLASEVAKHYILGMQDEGVMATVKHFAANNQEYARHTVSSDVDERTLNEIYFPAFRKAVQEAGVGAVMDSYNPVNGVHATENAWMNIDVLRNQWGFKGILMSDWTSTYSTVGIANGGLDLEMPKGVFFTQERLKAAIENGTVREEDIDLKVQHILQTLISFGMLDAQKPEVNDLDERQESRDAALQVAREGIVLLKNEGSLPMAKRGKILVMGPNADRIATGGGSGFVTPISSVSVYQGLVDAKGAKNVTLLSDDMLYKDIYSEIFTDETFSARGFKAAYYPNKKFEGEPVMERIDGRIDFHWKYSSPCEGLPDDGFCARWEGVYKAAQDGTLRFRMSGDDGYRIIVNGKQIGGDWGNHSLSSKSAFMDVKAGQTYNFRFEYFENVGEATVILEVGMMDSARMYAALKNATAVVYCAGFDSDIEGEGFDRGFALPQDQRRVIGMLSEAHPNVNVVLNAGGAVDFRGWSEDVESVLMAWYPGQEGGTAVADILTGKISPSGKLPISMENDWNDNPVRNSYYENAMQQKHVEYTEGIFVGYRGYDRSGKTPRYPFGYGLSYSSFGYSDLKVEVLPDGNVKVGVTLTNTGQMDAAEVVQVYVKDCEASVVRPEKELKGFSKIFLRKGETATVSVLLKPEDFAFYDVDIKDFRVEPGEFVIYAGGSSADLPLSERISYSYNCREVSEPTAVAEGTVPFMTNIYGRKHTSLNGKWNAFTDLYDQGRKMEVYKNRKPQDGTQFFEYSFEGGMRLDVPGDWNSQSPELKYYEGTMWYARHFDAPEASERDFLYFGAVSYRCRVYLNGEFIAEHEGGFTPFQVEVTGKLKEKDNFLCIEVSNRRTPDAIPAMNFDWWNYGGITRDVMLVQTPEVFVEDYFIRLDKHWADLVYASVKLSEKRSLECRIEIPELNIRQTVTTDSLGTATISFPVMGLQRWCRENPKLYDVTVSCANDSVSERIGFRNIEVRGEKILLNGEPVFMRSVSFHEEIPQRMGRAFSRPDAQMLISEAEALGVNMIRLAHYPQNEHIVRLAEERGILVWEEIPVWQGIAFDDEGTLAKAQKMLAEMIYRDRNRCAIGYWSIANETKPSPERNAFLRSLLATGKAIDTSRLYIAAFDLAYFDKDKKTFVMEDDFTKELDVVAVNKYMGWYHPWPCDPSEAVWDVAAGQPLIISEFGGEALYGQNGPDDEASSWSEDYQARLYRDNLEMFNHIPNLAGVSPWVLFDFRSPYRFHPTNQEGWNRKGLVSDKGQRKRAWYLMNEYYNIKQSLSYEN